MEDLFDHYERLRSDLIKSTSAVPRHLHRLDYAAWYENDDDSLMSKSLAGSTLSKSMVDATSADEPTSMELVEAHLPGEEALATSEAEPNPADAGDPDFEKSHDGTTGAEQANSGITVEPGEKVKGWGSWHRHDIVKHEGAEIGRIQTRQRNGRREVITLGKHGGAVMGHNTTWLLKEHKRNGEMAKSFAELEHRLEALGGVVEASPLGELSKSLSDLERLAEG